MVRNFGQMLHLELQNLHKDPESSKEAMKALKTYVEEMDAKNIPQFLTQLSEIKGIDEYTISLYKVVARAHGVSIAPHVDKIMCTTVKFLGSSVGSVKLIEGCAKVVQTIARYGIDPTMHEDKKRWVIHSLCKPLSVCLMDSRESLSPGATFCLKALVESENWRYASTEMANEVCVRATSALEGKCVKVISLMGLVAALAKRNALVVEAYARLLINAGLQILQDGIDEGDSEKGLSAIGMINSLMKNLDTKSILSEVDNVIEAMEGIVSCQLDQIEQVNTAAYECLHTAKSIVSGAWSEHTQSNNGLNIVQRDCGVRYSSTGRTRSIGSVRDFDSILESPVSRFQRSCENGYARRSTNRKLWRRSGESADFFLGHISGAARSSTPSPSRPRSSINVDNANIYSAPRKLMLSPANHENINSEIRRRQLKKFMSPCYNFDSSPLPSYDQNGSRFANKDSRGREYTSAESVAFHIGSEVVSSTEDVPPPTQDVVPQSKPEVLELGDRISRTLGRYSLPLCFLFLSLAIAISSFIISIHGENNGLVPT